MSIVAAMQTGTPAERIRTTLDLTALGEQMLRARLRRTHPECTEASVDVAVAAWYATRPGAEHGDLPGPVSDRRL